MSDTVSASTPSIEPVWKLYPPARPEVVSRVSRELHVPPLVASVLYARGLHEDLDSLKPRHEITGIPTICAAADRVAEAIERGERILVHGDYDADGITGSALAYLGLAALGANVRVYVPDRIANGYGINPAFVPRHAEGTDLFISVDCGITATAEVEALKAAGVDVIITDHHTPRGEMPACIVVHPDLNPGTPHGTPQLTGAGVAYHLLWAVRERYGMGEPVELSELAAIGTIADVAPLLGENRALVARGLPRMLESRWPGVKALCAAAFGEDKKTVTARDVAFMLAPRINASGRVGDANTAFDLLTTLDPAKAAQLAARLNEWNQERRDEQDGIYEQALSMVDPSEPAIVLEHHEWHPGIIGIVASKLVETYYRPVYLAARGKGSARSVPGISALGALEHAAQALAGFGGHTQAAGFTVKEGQFARFKALINEYAGRFPPAQPEIVLDALLAPGDATPELWEALCGLEPYGEGLPAPTFALAAPLNRARSVGRDGRHLQLHLGSLKGVSWGNGDLATTLTPGRVVTAACALQQNEWQGTKSIEFIATHVRSHRPLAYPCVNGGVPKHILRGPGKTGRRVTSIHVDTLDPTQAARHVRELVATGEVIRFDLTPADLDEAEKAARTLPGLPELRATLRYARAGRHAPLEAHVLEFCRQVLREVDLLDEGDDHVQGSGRHPYESETLQAALAEQYRILELVKAYRVVNDASFEEAVLTLFS